MSAEILLFGGYQDGELALDPATVDYVGGQPVEVTSAGVKLTIVGANYAGIFKNDKRDDIAGGQQAGDAAVSGTQVTTVIFGTNKVLLRPGFLTTGAVSAPFVFPGTGGGGWAVGDQIEVNGAGKWDNAGGGTKYGRVVKAPATATDTLEVYFYR